MKRSSALAERPRLSAASAQIAGWAVVGLVNTIAIAVLVPLPRTGAGTRAIHHVYEAGHALVLGFVSAVVVAVWSRMTGRWAAPRWLSRVLLVLFAAALAPAMLEVDLVGAAAKLGSAETVEIWLWLLLLAAGVAVALASAFGAWLSRRSRGPSLGVLLGVAIAVANNLVLANDYHGVHAYLAWLSALLLAASTTGLSLRSVRPSLSEPARALAVLLAALALVVPPSNAVQLQQFKLSGSPLAPLLARLRFRPDDIDLSGIAVWQPAESAAPASTPRLVPSNTIVVLISVDALRADVVAEGRHRDVLPNIEALRLSSVEFQRAHSPASGTIGALSSIFSGRYYSQLHWSVKPHGATRKVYPHDDATVRFPELVRDAGVATVNASWSLPDTANAYGVTRGFDTERFLASKYPPTGTLMSTITARIEAAQAEPLFLFAHFLEPHEPYDTAGTSGSPFENYLAEVAAFDKELGRLLATLAAPERAGRSVLILTADHGEAFGEHLTRYHSSSLYSELVDVPLLVHVPGVSPTRVRERVTLLDLGPTVLDLIGQATPPGFMGQSLVPFLRGERPVLTRPIAMDSGRLQRAMIFDDELKVIEDRRRGTVELYDLAADPGELAELSDERPEQTTARLAAMRAFFRGHQLERPGYETPYRP